MTIWVALFLLTLIPAVGLGLRRGGDSAVVAGVLASSFALAHLSWGSTDPLLANAAADLLCASVVVLFCSERWAMGVVALFALAVATSAAGALVGGDLQMTAHALSAVGHAQNIGLIIGGERDGGGLRIRGPQLVLGRHR